MAREQRKLAAIIAADVVGYSRLMGRDESGTLARLRKNRSEHLDPVLTRYGGRLVKLTGDGALVEFGSAVDALSAAIEFQQAMAEINSDQPADTALVFRMGLHLGDLIVDGDDLYGDAVNVADRLEAEAPPGSIVVSDAVREAVGARLKATFVDRGDLTLKNIERPIHAFGVKWEPADWPIQQSPASRMVSPAGRASRKRILWAAAVMGVVILAAGGYLIVAPQSAGTLSELKDLKADDLERLLAERRTADAAMAAKKRLEEEARAKAEAESATAQHAEAALKKAQEDRQKAEADLAKLKVEMAARQQGSSADQRQLTDSARRAAEEEAQRKAEVEMAALRQTEVEAQRKAASDVENRRKADEALAIAQRDRQRAEAEARAKADAQLASGVVVHQSNNSVAVTVQRFEDVMRQPRENKVLVLQATRKTDVAEEAEKAGLRTLPWVVLEFGNPTYSATNVYVAPTAKLDTDPIRVVVWQDGQEKVWLAYNSAEWWARKRGRQQNTTIQMVDEYQRVMSEAAKAATQ